MKCWGAFDGEPETGVPVDVPGLAGGVRSVVAGQGFTCALTDAGGAKCWGSNEYGQLGDGSTDDREAAVDVHGLLGGVQAIAAGYSHACALTTPGGVKCWGPNDDGELGDGTTDDSPVPVDVSGLTRGVRAIAAGASHTCAVMSTGKVTCWGAHDPGLPVDVAGLPGDVVSVAVAWYHACALTSGAEVHCWGSNGSGELGDGTTTDSAVPVAVAGLEGGARAISVGVANTCAVTKAGGVRCWGSGYGPRDRDGIAIGSSVPVDVAGLPAGVIAIAVGEEHACALTRLGRVYCWGSNEYGQLGNDSMEDSSIPVEVDFASREPVVDASGAIVHATGATDVVLRYDHRPDFRQPGPEFTLYGDGTIIFRDETLETSPAKGRIVRGSPFSVAHLTEDRVQSLLRFALTEAGLAVARSFYPGGGEGCVDTDAWVYTVRAGGIERRVESGGCQDAFWFLAEHLRSVGGSSTSEVWAPGSYSARLLKASSLIKRGVLPKVTATAIPWPWPDIAPAGFTWREDRVLGREGRRVMSTDEAAALGWSDNGGVLQRVYLLGPDGKTVYLFSLWPRLPDEAN